MTTRNAGLDWLRIAAAALVLFAHGGGLLYSTMPSYTLYSFSGVMGIELFFALSGFLVVAWLLEKPPQDGAGAMSAVFVRLRRIVPLFLLFLLINMLLFPALQRALPAELWAYPFLLQNTIGLHPAFFAEAWNLPILVLFSILAPWLVLAVSRSGSAPQRLAILLFVLVVIGMIGRTLVALQTPEWDAGIRKFLPARLDACAYGGLLACWWRSAPSARAMAVAALIGVALAVLAAIWFWSFSGGDAVSDCALLTLIGVACALPLPWLCRGRSGRWLEISSRATWVLYFVNMPLLLIAMRLGAAELGGLLAFVLWVIVCLAVTALLYWPLMALSGRRSR